MSVTHQEIADRTGVSRALVTRALHRTHRARVSPKTRHKIHRIAREMGYQPRNFTTHNIGFVGQADALRFAGESRFLLLIDEALGKVGFRLVLTSLRNDDETLHIEEVLNPKTVDGVIFTRWFGGKVCNVISPEVPWIVVSDEDAIPDTVDKVVMDTVRTTEDIVDHLIELGHRHVGIVSSPRVEGGVTEHLHLGVRNSFLKAGLPKSCSSVEVRADREIAECMKHVMRQPDAPTAFVVFGAEKAVTSLNVLNFLRFRVPEDVSLVSVVDSHLLEPMFPSITSTTGMGVTVAEQAVARLLEKIQDPDTRACHTLIKGELIHRNSVQPVREKLGGS